VSPTVLRYALISNQYLQPMNFTLDALAQAKASVERIQTRYERLVEAAGDGDATPEVEALVASCSREFDQGLEDNVNMPNALAAVFRLVGELNQRALTPGDARLARGTLEGFDAVLAVLDRRVRSGIVTKEDLDARAVSAALPPLDALRTGPLDVAKIEALILHRQASKKAKDFATADGLRRDLDQRGVALEDLPAGVRWRLK
jgi:cysteinyl-tRNA synthetase